MFYRSEQLLSKEFQNPITFYWDEESGTLHGVIELVRWKEGWEQIEQIKEWQRLHTCEGIGSLCGVADTIGRWGYQVERWDLLPRYSIEYISEDYRCETGGTCGFIWASDRGALFAVSRSDPSDRATEEWCSNFGIYENLPNADYAIHILQSFGIDLRFVETRMFDRRELMI